MFYTKYKQFSYFINSVQWKHLYRNLSNSKYTFVQFVKIINTTDTYIFILCISTIFSPNVIEGIPKTTKRREGMFRPWSGLHRSLASGQSSRWQSRAAWCVSERRRDASTAAELLNTTNSLHQSSVTSEPGGGWVDRGR